MHINEVRKIAKLHGVKASRLSKINIIREIQRHEGNFDCFGTAYGGKCDQMKCLWRIDCLTLAKKQAYAA